MKITNIYLPEDQREWLSRQPGGMAGKIRELVAAAMRDEEHEQLKERIRELEERLEVEQ